MTNPRWQKRPEGSTWGDFGADDQLGRLNLITAEQVRAGIAEVQVGRTFCLSLPLDLPGGNVLNPRRHPPQLSPTYRAGKPYINFPLSRIDPGATDIVSDDQVLLTLQYSTQWDTYAHVGSHFDADGDGHAEKVYYNGYRAGEHVRGPIDYEGGNETLRDPPYGALALGVENMAVKAIQGRAVLIDLKAHFGMAKRAVSFNDIRDVIAADRVEIGRGDMVLLRTGFGELLMQMGGKPDLAVLHDSCCGLDGSDERLLQWITDTGISALIADNYAVEHYPPRPRSSAHGSHLPLHQHCLFKLGLPLGEMWWLGELADWLRAAGRSRFLLTAPPLRLPRAVGSPATPVATV